MRISEVVKKDKRTLIERLKRTLRRGPITLEELSSRYDRGVNQIEAAIEELRERGFNCQIKAGAAEILRDLRAGGVHKIDPKQRAQLPFWCGFGHSSWFQIFSA